MDRPLLLSQAIEYGSSSSIACLNMLVKIMIGLL